MTFRLPIDSVALVAMVCSWRGDGWERLELRCQN